MFPEEYARVILPLKEKIREWQLASTGVILKPVAAGFDLMVVARQPLGFSSDYKWVFTASVIVEWPADRLEEAYRRAKMMECEAEFRGLIRRRYSLVESSVKKSVFRGSPFDDRLARGLEDAGIVKLLEKASPDEFSVNTYYDLKPGKSALESMLEAFSRPSKLGWLVTASKGPIAELIFPRVARSMYMLLDETSHALRRLTPALLGP